MTCFPKQNAAFRIIFRAAARAQVIPDIHVHHATESKGSIAFHLKVHDLTLEDIDENQGNICRVYSQILV